MKNKLIHRTEPRRQRRRGFTLTEIAIVLGIIGLILGAIWVAAAAVYNNLRTSHANTEVLQIAQAVRTLYGNTNTAAGLTVDNLVCAKAVPSDMVNAACGGPATLVDPFPGGVTTVIPTADNLGFQISMTGVTQSACIDILMAVGGSTHDPGLFMATGTAAAAAAAAAGAETTPIAPGGVINAVATPANAQATAAGNFGGCTSTIFAPSGTVNFGFGLKT